MLIGFYLPSVEAATFLAINPQATLDNRLILTLTGTFACEPDYYLVYLNVKQASGREVAHGQAYVVDSETGTLTCDGNPHPFSVVVEPDAGGPPWHGGNAAVDGFFSNGNYLYTPGQIIKITGGKQK